MRNKKGCIAFVLLLLLMFSETFNTNTVFLCFLRYKMSDQNLRFWPQMHSIQCTGNGEKYLILSLVPPHGTIGTKTVVWFLW